MQSCPVHKQAFSFKEGVSKATGKPYAFWTCSLKMPDGSWCKEKPANPAEAAFISGLDESNAREQQTKKDDSIARAVALKAAVDLWRGIENSDMGTSDILETAREFLVWLKEKPKPRE